MRGIFEEPPPLLTAQETRRWDEGAIAGLGIPERLLMENAGRAVARAVARLYPAGRVVGVIGGGKNGGDTLVALRTLRSWGRDVVAIPVDPDRVPPAELTHRWSVPTAEDAGRALGGAGVILDGILGTGARGAPREPHAGAIRAIRAAGRPVLALDGPSGVDLTTGEAPGEAVQAEVTVTFGAAKRGLLLFPGRTRAGRVLVAEVGFPPLEEAVGARVITSDWARGRLPRIPPDAHKGRLGVVAVLAGRPGMAGASILAAMGALRTGAGGVRVVAPEQNRVPVQTAVPEALFDVREPSALESVLDRSAALLAGPGMGTDAGALESLRRALAAAKGPVLLDADAITLLASEPDLLDGVHDRTRVVLTPHPGEMARLLGRDAQAVTGDTFGAAAEAVHRFGAVVLLKGFPSVVAAPEAPTLVNPYGHPGIATGGMGDTMAGVIAALLAMGTEARDAAALGLCFSGLAAEAAGRGRSLLPRDVAEALPGVIWGTPPEDDPIAPEILLDLRPFG